MNSAELQLAKREAASQGAKRVLAQRHLIDFAQYVDPMVTDDDGRYISGWKDPPHLRYIAEALEEVEAGNVRRLFISVPPRHGKTELVGTKFCSWYLARHTDRRVMYVTHTADLAKGVSRSCRNVIQQNPYFSEAFPNVHVPRDTAEVMRWAAYCGIPGLKHIGKDPSFFASGVAGPLTGHGAHLMVLDDLIKDRVEAYSKAARDNIWQWWLMTARTRLNPGACVVHIATRWHADDFAARLLADKEWGEFKVINLPALAEEDDPLGRQIGEALWPSEYSADDWHAIRKSSPSVFAAMYQGQPIPAEGAMMKPHWFGEYIELPKDPEELVIALDSATSEKTSADFTAMMVGARTSTGNIDILEIVRRQIEAPDLEAQIVRLWSKWRHIFHKRLKAFIMEEDQFARSVIQYIKKQHPEIPIITDRPDADKISRVAEVSCYLEAGRVRLPRFAVWLPDFLDEIKSFPLGVHDDQVDALVYLVRRLCRLVKERKDTPSVISSSMLGKGITDGM